MPKMYHFTMNRKLKYCLPFFNKQLKLNPFMGVNDISLQGIVFPVSKKNQLVREL